ncbi:unnamed protein product [Prorocentrum cordatum]|uniref:S1 motif domain-containing protein n=1 Tax=Prorocentrum cordatum TaxID=2364126 RepID=A0ABN9QXL2_9DINO|nr:unnamed protein product [Polarella glacialis]
MAPGATAGRRGRGRGLAAALALAAACRLLEGPLAFLAAGGGARRERARGALAAGPRGPSGRPWRTALGARPDMALEVGCKVKAMSPDDERWYPGRVTGEAAGGWVVAWDDPDGGPETNTLAEEYIKKVIIFKGYQVGDDCRAISPDDGRFYPGTVAELLGEEKFRVKWDDPDGGAETAEVHAESMRKVVVKRDYKEGDAVLGRFPEDGMMYPGTVLKKNEDGTFAVKWEDPDGGPEQSDVSPKDMRIPPIPFDSLEVGQEFQGTVRSVRDFGAFVDIGAEVDGLLHIGSISTDKIEDIYSVLEDDQEVKVWISGLRDDGKFGLTMIEGRTDSAGGRRRVESDFTPFSGASPDEWFEGEVTNTASFGAFIVVTAEDGTQALGLCHVSQIADAFVDNINDHVSVGQKVKVRVISVDMDANKMSLSMKESGGGAPVSREPADLSAFESVSPDEWLTGKVARCASFGAFVEVTAPDGATADGLVHITQIKDGFVENVADELEPGQEVKVRVVSVDVGAGKMTLSMIEEGAGFGGGGFRVPPDLSAFESVSSDEWLTGKVARCASFGAFVEVTAPDGATADGLVHITQIKDGFVENVADELEPGQEVKVRVVSRRRRRGQDEPLDEAGGPRRGVRQCRSGLVLLLEEKGHTQL